MRISFTALKKNKVLVYDNNGYDLLKKTALTDLDATVLHTRRELLYANPQLILFFLKNLNKLNLRELMCYRNLLGQLFRIYLLSAVETVKPKLVITIIDNDYMFHWLARNYKQSKFCAVQNGVRLEVDISKRLPKYPHSAHKITIPSFFCFGDREVNMYKKHKHDINDFHPVGSLRGALYRSITPKKMENTKFDVCLVSQWDKELIETDKYKSLVTGLERLENLLSKYLSDNNGRTKFCIAMRTNNPIEREHFYKVFGDKVVLVGNEQKSFSTYSLMDSSELIITFCSTAAFEALGWGAKVLFCNFSTDVNYDVISDMPWSFSEYDYLSFKRAIESFLEMNVDEYKKVLLQDRHKYYMNYIDEREGGTIKYLKNFVEEVIH